MANQSLSPMQNEKNDKKGKGFEDPCPVCKEELYLDDQYTQRVGLLGDFDEVVGWLCPHCKSEFDEDDHLTKFLGENGTRGEA